MRSRTAATPRRPRWPRREAAGIKDKGFLDTSRCTEGKASYVFKFVGRPMDAVPSSRSAGPG